MRRLLAAAWPCAILLLLLAGALRSAAVATSGAAAVRPEWQVLTRANFSSQIRLHPDVLLIVTMPWYGESRALMADIEHLVGSNEELGCLKMMVVYRNSEKLLTDAIVDISRKTLTRESDGPLELVGADESGGEAIFPVNRPSVVDSLSVEESEYKTTDNSFATTDTPNDDTKVSVDENTAKETEYIDDGQAPSILEKTLTTYPDGHDNAFESDVTEAEDQNKSEASDMSPDLHAEVPCNAYSSEVGGFMWKKRATTQDDAPQAIQFQISDKGSDNVGYDLPSHSDVVTGSILTATEKLETAVPFDKAKVLIVSSDSHEGFQGLIINKRLSWGVFKSLDSSMEPIKHAPFFYGGPVVVQGYHLVSLSRVALEGYMQVIPGIYYGNIIATSRVVTRIKSGEQSTDDLWFFLGYSGWGYNQLSDELSEGAWLVSEKPIEHLDWPES
nr:unnamed protein product [Digitaria exilis]